MDAVHIVRSMPHLTQAPVSIQQPIQQRIDKYFLVIIIILILPLSLFRH